MVETDIGSDAFSVMWEGQPMTCIFVMRVAWPDLTWTWPGILRVVNSRSLLEDIIPDLSDAGEEGLGKGKRVRVLQAVRMKMNKWPVLRTVCRKIVWNNQEVHLINWDWRDGPLHRLVCWPKNLELWSVLISATLFTQKLMQKPSQVKQIGNFQITAIHRHILPFAYITDL